MRASGWTYDGVKGFILDGTTVQPPFSAEVGDVIPAPADRNIMAVHSGKCLDVEAASPDNRASVQQWDCHGGNNQKWMVTGR